jgi:hypothetical protein
MNGANSLDTMLSKGTNQSDRIVVYIIGTNDADYISREVKFAFQQNKDLKEILLLKGSRLISFKRDAIKSKHFEDTFRKEWTKNK